MAHNALFTPAQTQRISMLYESAMERVHIRRPQIDEMVFKLADPESTALKYIYAFLPLSDAVSCDTGVILSCARHALRLREMVGYVSATPASLFLNYVLFPRVSDEQPLDDHRASFFHELYPRVRGKGMLEAAREVGYWCGEKVATALPAGERTLPPAAVVRSAAAGSAEASILAVCALRSVGLPARQCYCPGWSHKDGGGAWVEFWAGGGWHRLPLGGPGFGEENGQTAQAMLVCSRVFSDAAPEEELLCAAPLLCTVNSTGTYGPCKTLLVAVRRQGRPCPGVPVRFEICSGAQLVPVCTLLTDAEGCAYLTCGLGDIWLHVPAGEGYVAQKVDVRLQDSVLLDLSAAGRREGCEDFDMVPPAGGEPVPPPPVPGEDSGREHECRLRRASRLGTYYSPASAAARCAHYGRADLFAGFLVRARGNHRELLRFYEAPGYSEEDKCLLLQTLTPRDLLDVTSETLCDCLAGAIPYKKGLPPEVYRAGVLAPRVDDEPLRPCRLFIRRFFSSKKAAPSCPQEVWACIAAHTVCYDPFDAQGLTADPREVLLYGCSTARTNDVLFVQVCRSLGFPARLNPQTGEKEYWAQGAFLPLQAGDEGALGDTAALTLVNGGALPLAYGEHFTLGRLANGVFCTLRHPGLVLRERETLRLPAGSYRALTALRREDGALLARAYYLHLGRGEQKKLTLSLREAGPGGPADRPRGT